MLAARRSIPVVALEGRLGDDARGAMRTSEPLLVTADDADLAGPAMRRALADVAARIPGAPVLLLASTSLGGLDTETARLLEVPGTERLLLGDLSREATAELLRARLGDAPEPALVDAVHAATRGTPAVAAAVALDVHCHVQAGATWTAGRLGRLGTAALLASLQRHVGGPETPAARLAFAAAIAGPQFDAIDAMRIAGLAGEEAGAAYDLLVDRGLMRGPMGASRFRHPVVPLGLERALGVSLRATLHARAAAVLHAAGEPAVDVARQLLHAVPTGEPWRVQVLLAAAEELRERGIADKAQALARRARTERGAAPEHSRSSEDVGRSQTLEDALATFLGGGDVEPVARTVLEALDGGLARTDPRALALAAPLVASGRLPEAERHLAEVEAAATAVAADDTAVAAAGARAMVLLARGRLDDSLQCARGALAASESEAAAGRGFAHATLARALLRRGKLDAAAAELDFAAARDRPRRSSEPRSPRRRPSSPSPAAIRWRGRTTPSPVAACSSGAAPTIPASRAGAPSRPAPWPGCGARTRRTRSPRRTCAWRAPPVRRPPSRVRSRRRLSSAIPRCVPAGSPRPPGCWPANTRRMTGWRSCWSTATRCDAPVSVPRRGPCCGTRWSSPRRPAPSCSQPARATR